MVKRIKKTIKKRGNFFSIDALIAVIIIFFAMSVIFSMIIFSSHESLLKQDILEVMKDTKISDISSYPEVNQMISDGNISDTSKSVLQEIGELYLTNKDSAKKLAKAVLDRVHTNENLGIWVENDLLASKNFTPLSENSRTVTVEREFLSGMSNTTEGLTGFSSKAFLGNSNSVDYYYFGGYVGEGNISKRVFYNGTLNSAEMELTCNKNFNLYINGIFSGSLPNSSSEYTPRDYTLPTGNFHPGENLIELKAPDFHISGGYIKLNYKKNLSFEKENETKYYLPGITGIVNLYDGFFARNGISEMEAYLHLKGNSNGTKIYFTIGRTKVFEKNVTAEETILLDNANLSSSLHGYSLFRNKNVPFRIGVYGNTVSVNVSTSVKLVSVADISGSMDGTPLDSSKNAHYTLINSILKDQNNSIGLVAYDTYFEPSYSLLPVTNNATALNNTVNNWIALGATCICCGIHTATDELKRYVGDNSSKVILVMSDGGANVACTTGNAIADAINESRYAHNNFNITVYSVGFGSYVDVATMQSIASAGGGQYFSANVTNIIEIYQNISNIIINAAESYSEQTISTNTESTLYPDSYIQLTTPKNKTPYGLEINYEKKFDNANQVSFPVPTNTNVYDANAISYSGPKWTNNARINGINFYNLSFFGDNYTKLGDPFVFGIPISYMNPGNNVLEISLGIDPSGNSPGSEYNKIIYHAVRPAEAYSQCENLIDEKVCRQAVGCIWNIEFFDGTTSIIKIPSNYSGIQTCNFKTQTYKKNDAIDSAAFNLFKDLDFDNDGRLDIKVDSSDISIDSFELEKIPYTWSFEVQVRRWD